MAKNVSQNKMSFAEKLQTLEELWDELCRRLATSPDSKDTALTKKNSRAHNNKEIRDWNDAGQSDPDRQDRVSNR